MVLTGEGKTILAVDDDYAILNLIGDILQPHGFRVLGAQNGMEAIRIAEQVSGDIDILLSDVVMPEMPGPQLAVRLKQMYPDMRVMFISGFMKPGTDLEVFGDEEPAFLRKPFTPSELTSKLKEFL